MKTIDLNKIFEEYQDKFICSNSHNPDIYYKAAMREACNQTIELCVSIQKEAYKERGFTNTGEKISEIILNAKNQII